MIVAVLARMMRAVSKRFIQHRSWFVLAIAAAVVGCGGLRVAMVDSAYQRPSNVAVYFTVDTAGGDPVGGLQATDFRIYEDGQLVSPTESEQTIVNPEVAAEHYTLLLVDMSGSVVESDQVPALQQAATEFTAQLEGHQKVAVYAFDGAEDLYAIADFTSGGGAQGAIGRLGSFRPRDPSTNLHGAVVQGIAVLDAELARSRVPLRFGTIVVFTDGSDRAARITRNEMGRAIDASPYDIFAIGVGSEIDEGTLGAVGRDGYVLVEDTAAVTQAFQQIGAHILAMTQRFYLLSYCSPARAGTHEVTVEAVTPDARGSLTYEFDATGFGPDCNPSRPPPFAIGNARNTRTRPRAERGARIEVRATAQ
ncbi:hypothetical protein DB32_002771 [Sandaracinus amylolyticus]|uniref:VWFA domain-containing protein n=1 Tax=Sandaracinus amylolyticus TaxID=927083 RepID=A0A0F6YHZ7_9BACT|nr:hypothetical protein DB32_002771 [Sandaracinus amylolyticus]